MRALYTALLLSLWGASSLPAQGRGSVAFVNASVLPMDRDTLLTGQTVVIRDGIIQQVGPSRQVRIPAGATRIEAGGKFLMPGLVDLHVHMAGPREVKAELLKMYAVNGVTTIMNLRGTPDDLALRSDIRIRPPDRQTARPPDRNTRFIGGRDQCVRPANRARRTKPVD